MDELEIVRVRLFPAENVQEAVILAAEIIDVLEQDCLLDYCGLVNELINRFDVELADLVITYLDQCLNTGVYLIMASNGVFQVLCSHTSAKRLSEVGRVISLDA